MSTFSVKPIRFSQASDSLFPFGGRRAAGDPEHQVNLHGPDIRKSVQGDIPTVQMCAAIVQNQIKCPLISR
jgi:hypothetical protein